MMFHIDSKKRQGGGYILVRVRFVLGKYIILNSRLFFVVEIFIVWTRDVVCSSSVQYIMSLHCTHTLACTATIMKLAAGVAALAPRKLPDEIRRKARWCIR